MDIDTKNYIDDNVRKATDSSIQALTGLIREIQLSQKEHREEERQSREIYREKMLNAVEEKIKIVVNGKIDKIAQDIKELKPMFEQYKDRKGFWKTVSEGSKNIGMVAGAIIAIGVIIAFLTK